MAKTSVNVKQLMEDMDRYLAFCHRRQLDNPKLEPVKRIVLTPMQYAEFVKKTGKAKYNGIDVVAQ